MMNTRILLLSVAILAFSLTDVQAQPATPAPPKTYQVRLRYQIQANRNERIVQFRAMLKYLESIGFNKDPGEENEAADASLNRMTGTISSANAHKLLEAPHVRSVLLMPPDFKVPEDVDQPVKVQLELVSGLPLDRQRALFDQVVEKLRQLGFREGVAFDHRHYTRIVGTIPAGQLETLLKDLRWEPTGWLAPIQAPATLPTPLRRTSPILLTEVIPEPEGTPPMKEVKIPEPPKPQEFLSPDLRALLAQEGEAAKPRRLEVILSRTPSIDDSDWRKQLAQAAPGLSIEGRLGQLVTVVAQPSQAPALAALPMVSAVRLPRSGMPQIQPAADSKDANRAALQASGLARLHAQGHKGKGIKVAIVDSDFRGYQPLMGKQLPARTKYLDLTAAANANLTPEPFPGDPKVLGYGTQCALAAALAAPEAELTLIRVDPTAPYQLELVARAINGEQLRFDSLEARRNELRDEEDRIRLRRNDLLRERRLILDDFGQDEASKKKREAYFKKQTEFDEEEKASRQRGERYLQLLRDLRDLRGIRLVASSLVWNEGHPVDGSSPLSRYLDDRPFHSAMWLQSAGNTRGQVWSGFFRDHDGNGVMEFALPDTRIPRGRWTSELNFLGWQPFQGKVMPILPAKTILRVAIQWREAHDPALARGTDDPYREPLANLRLVLLRQRDPTGKKLAGDDMEVVAYSVGPALRLQNLPNSATYEQTLEYTVASPGRYALRVEGRAPTSIRPANVAAIATAEQRFGELRTRIFLDVGEGAVRSVGRPVFLDYATNQGEVGMPADAHSAITIGAADASDQPRSYSAKGSPLGLALLNKPNLLAYDSLELAPEGTAIQGTNVATSFAAGLAAAAMNAGMSRSHFLHLIPEKTATILRAPEQGVSSR